MQSSAGESRNKLGISVESFYTGAETWLLSWSRFVGGVCLISLHQASSRMKCELFLIHIYHPWLIKPRMTSWNHNFRAALPAFSRERVSCCVTIEINNCEGTNASIMMENRRSLINHQDVLFCCSTVSWKQWAPPEVWAKGQKFCGVVSGQGVPTDGGEARSRRTQLFTLTSL